MPVLLRQTMGSDVDEVPVRERFLRLSQYVAQSCELVDVGIGVLSRCQARSRDYLNQPAT